MSPTAEQPPKSLPLEQLRDLYERIPFAQGRARVALLHRLRRVSLEVRQARLPKGALPGSLAIVAAGAVDAKTMGGQALADL